ncbi:hypothetical protein D3C77_457760 [compost metagenome]
MRYLTKKWYRRSQQTCLHYGKRVHKGAKIMDEALYLRLYKRKEKQFVRSQRETYDYDPRVGLEQMIPVEVWLYGETKATNLDEMLSRMSPEAKQRFQHEVAVFDARPPFDVEKCKQDFRKATEWNLQHDSERLPIEIHSQIADLRVFTLGYCTKEVLQLLKKQSKINEKIMKQTYDMYWQSQSAEPIPSHIRDKFNFHDCRVRELINGENLIMKLDTTGGFTHFNKMTFVKSEIILQEEDIIDNYWLYSELYCVEGGYEVHVLFAGSTIAELIIKCHDIIIEQEG